MNMFHNNSELEDILQKMEEGSSEEDEEGNEESENYNSTRYLNDRLDEIQGLSTQELLDILEDNPHPNPHYIAVAQTPQTPQTVHTGQIAQTDQTAQTAPMPTYAQLQSVEREWTTDIPHFTEHKFDVQLEPTQIYDNHKALPSEYFDNLFPNELLELIVQNTNKYATIKKSKFWSPTNVDEIKAFLALIILMGISPASDIELYWSSDPFYRNIEICQTMTCKRFKKILENLHVCDITTHLPRKHIDHDKLQKIRPMLTILNNTFKENATVSQTQSIDESMIKFKGRDSKKQYMPMKPVKRGFKAWCRCDAKTGYLYECSIYVGKDDLPSEDGLGYRVINKLSENLPNGTLLVFDNFFSTPAIMESLYNRGIYALATVRKDRKGLPKDLTAPVAGTKKEQKRNKLNPGEFSYRFCHPIGVLKWKDSKDVYVMTTAVNPRKVETITRRQKNGEKKEMYCPSAIVEYTKHMGGVDHFDNFRSSYAIGRRSKKSWFRLFWFLFECAVINAYILFCVSKKNITENCHRKFRLRLARSLKSEFVSRRQYRKPLNFINKKGGNLGVPSEISLNQQGHFLQPSTYRRCRFCSTRREEKRSRYECKICKVALCVTPCMELYHTTTNFD